MGLRDRVNTALKQAMKDKATTRLGTLRLVNAAIKDQDIEARGNDSESVGVSDTDILAILAKMSKQRLESVRAYEEGGRLDLAEREQSEISVIEEFLPRKMSDAEVAEAIETAIAEAEATSIRDMGKVIGKLKSQYTGQMDFGRVGPMVKAQLG